MADNITYQTTVATPPAGSVVRCLEDGSGVLYPAGVTCFATSIGTPDVISIVTPTAGLPVQQQTGATWTVDTELPAAAALADDTANPTTTSVGTFPHWYDGTTWDRARGTSADGLLVNLGSNNDVTVTGTVSATQSGTWTVQPGNTANTTAWLVTGTGGTFPVTDSGGSLTIDNATLSVTGGGVEASALRVTIASDSTGLVSVDDNGGSLTVDGTVAATQSGTWTVQPGNTANTTAWLVTGTGGTFPVTDSGGSLTVDNAALSVTGGGVEASALRVTIASDSTGLVSVDDNGGSLTVDGTVAATQSGTWTVQPGNTANTTAWLVTGTGGTFPVTDSGGSLTVDNGGTFVVQINGDALTSLQLLDDAIFTDDAAYTPGTSKLMVIGAQADETGPDSVDEGDAGALRMTLARALHVNVRDDAGDSCMDGTNNAVRVNIVAGAAAGGTSSTDDSAFTAASGAGTPMMGFVTADSVDSGDVGVVGMLANRQLKVTLYDSAGAELAVGGGTQYDEDAAHSTGSKVTGCGIVRKDSATSLAGTDGDYTLPIADANGKLWVNSEVTVALPAGTNAIGKLAANSGVDIGDVDVTSVVPGTGATSLGKAEDAAHVSGDTGVFVLTVRADSAASTAGTDGDYAALTTDASGRLWCAVGNTVTVTQSTAANLNCTEANSAAIKTAVEIIDDAILADDAAFSVGSSKVCVAGFVADETTTDSVDEGDVGASRMTLDRKLISTLYPHTAGGCSTHKTVSAATTNATNVKGSAGQLYGVQAFNTNASARYLKIYNKATAPTVGTDTPVKTLLIPGNTAGAGLVLSWANGLELGNGIGFALTTGVADSDTASVAANEIVVNLDYK